MKEFICGVVGFFVVVWVVILAEVVSILLGWLIWKVVERLTGGEL